MPVPLAAISLGLSLGSSLLGIGSSRRARRRQRRAEALQAKRSAIINVRNRRAALAAMRRQQSKQQVAAIASGMSGGSADFATRSSLTSQATAELANQSQQIELGGAANANIAAANRYTNQASTFNNLSGLIGQVGNYANQQKALEQPTMNAPVSTLPTGVVNDGWSE